MDAKTRAEKIWHQLQVLALSHTEVEFLAAQIEEAEREARDSGIRSGKEEALKEWTKPFNDAYAEGFRAAREKAKGMLSEKGDWEEIAQRIGEMEP